MQSTFKKTKNTKHIFIGKKHGLKNAMLDCSTRWNSTFDMLKRFLDYQTFCTDVLDPELTIAEDFWEFCSDFIEIFEPVKKLDLIIMLVKIKICLFIFTQILLKEKKHLSIVIF